MAEVAIVGFWNGLGGKVMIGSLSLGLGAVINHFAFRFNENHKRRQAKSEVHLTDIKSRVLERLINMVAYHWIPMLRLNRSPLFVTSQIVTQPVSSVKQDSRKGSEWVLVLQTPSNEQYFRQKELMFFDNRWMFDLDHVLYRDARDNHFPELFREIDECQKRVEEYQKRILTLALSVKAQLVSKVDLPEYNLDHRLPYWKNTPHVAKYVVDKALKIIDHHIFSQVHDGAVVMAVSGTQDGFFKLESEKKAECLYGIVDELISSFPINAAVAGNSALADKLERLLAKLNELKSSEVLPNTCKLQWPA